MGAHPIIMVMESQDHGSRQLAPSLDNSVSKERQKVSGMNIQDWSLAFTHLYTQHNNNNNNNNETMLQRWSHPCVAWAIKWFVLCFSVNLKYSKVLSMTVQKPRRLLRLEFYLKIGCDLWKDHIQWKNASTHSNDSFRFSVWGCVVSHFILQILANMT